MSNRGEYVIGMRPDGLLVYVSESLLAKYGMEKLRQEFIDCEYIRKGMDPPGYHRIRINPFNYDYVLVYGPTHAEALKKYLRKTTNRYNKI